ncbi:hypothetical protein [Kitasatospora purpeofusca]|uniref:hypothetical protein n=1 Tax=Kitasatospora purpeofusca TaxID=67352 RepID=UPI0038659F60
MSPAELSSAAQACVDVVSRGGGDAIAAQALNYVSEATWDALVERHRGKGCEALAARGLQAAGIFVCFTAGGTMQDCACVRDLLVNEGKTLFDNLLRGALQNWGDLPSRMQDAIAAPGTLTA